MLIYLHDEEMDYAYDENDPEGLVAQFQKVAEPHGIRVVATGGLSTSFLEILVRIGSKTE
ncbi:hypothetical protein RM844_29810 [Streptomyces sp. DSM 44915]|uniref:Uncharacterized protein n=1 Tax=Streptomyces chisholmiae TaxID=3075540 RepID=A0ABU2JZQ7_9ACTN|nr:hypothetical protein [Streptomyces sp. DSM 44915]MDT0270475.1 hypothetical protein [Streptomyces sp. DSM 44915]